MVDNVVEVNVEVKNSDGLHMRPAMQFVDVASQFRSKVTVCNDETQVDGKSIMHMTMLAATQGTKLKIITAGDDAQKAADALYDLVEIKMFNEK